MTQPAAAHTTAHTTATVVRPEPPFVALPERIARHAAERPEAPALIVGEWCLGYAAFNARVDQIAAALQRDGAQPQQVVAICATASAEYVALYIAALRAGLVVAPLPPGATAAQLAGMLADAQPRWCFVDAEVARALDAAGQPPLPGMRRLRLDDSVAADGGGTGNSSGSNDTPFTTWLAGAPARPQPVAIAPEWAFNIIYSSGTTGTPKGIVQSHAMREMHIERALLSGYNAHSVALLATPLYSNTTLVALLPTLAHGGCAVLMPKFDALRYLQLAQQHRATHTMLVPVQYQRLMACPEFERFDLSSFRAKQCTSAPFLPALKARVLARWPGGLVEVYGMTEGGGTTVLLAHLHPTKLHTVGHPVEGHDIRLIDDNGRELRLRPGTESATGEVVGRSPGMMTGYHGQPARTAEAEWFDAQGRRYIRTGDVGRFDADGFLILGDRRKDMVISGGFNIYPSDLEAVLCQHPAVAEAAVFGIASAEWGETPVAMVVLRVGGGGRDGQASPDAETLRAWVNARVGKTQRLAALRFADELPRSAIGKVLKRELRDGWQPA